MNQPGNSLEEDFKKSNLKRLYNLCCRESDQNIKFERQKCLIKISTEENIRYINLELIEKERRKSVPQLNLFLSPLILRRQLQKNIKVNPTILQKAESNSQNSIQSNSPIKRSRYVQEIEKVTEKQQEFQYEKTLKEQCEIQKDAFRNYNRYKMLTNEISILMIFIVGVILYKICYFKLLAQQLLSQLLSFMCISAFSSSYLYKRVLIYQL